MGIVEEPLEEDNTIPEGESKEDIEIIREEEQMKTIAEIKERQQQRETEKRRIKEVPLV